MEEDIKRVQELTDNLEGVNDTIWLKEGNEALGDAILRLLDQARKSERERVIEKIEQEYNTNLFCDTCEHWCKCWEKFKKEQIGGEE